MAYRWHPKYSEVDPDSPRAWGTCDRCGRIWNLHRLQWQFDYRGSRQLQNIRVLVCPTCYDKPQPQLSPVILEPDPPPIYNARPEAYAIDETSWISEQPGFGPTGDGGSGNIIVTQDGDPLVIENNPSTDPNTVHFVASLAQSGVSVATAYLDFYNGNPLSGGASVLFALTGSATRTNVASELTTIYGVAQNADYIVITAAASAQTNVNYLAVYDSASGGTLLVSGPLAVKGPPPSVTAGAPVVFDQLDLQINTN